MIEFICIFFPGLIAAGRCNLKRDINKLIVNYGGYTIFINIFTIWIMHSLGFIKKNVLVESNFKLDFALYYVLIAVVLAFILPTIVNYITVKRTMRNKKNDQRSHKGRYSRMCRYYKKELQNCS